MWKTGDTRCFTCAQPSPGDQHWGGVSAEGVQAHLVLPRSIS